MPPFHKVNLGTGRKKKHLYNCSPNTWSKKDRGRQEIQGVSLNGESMLCSENLSKTLVLLKITPKVDLLASSENHQFHLFTN